MASGHERPAASRSASTTSRCSRTKGDIQKPARRSFHRSRSAGQLRARGRRGRLSTNRSASRSSGASSPTTTSPANFDAGCSLSWEWTDRARSSVRLPERQHDLLGIRPPRDRRATKWAEEERGRSRACPPRPAALADAVARLRRRDPLGPARPRGAHSVVAAYQRGCCKQWHS